MKLCITFLLTALLLSPFSGFAAEEDPFSTLKQNVKKITLDNGLRVIYLKRANAPVFSGNVFVKAGGVDEVVGKTGVAHFLEHIAFKGSKTIGTKDFKRETELNNKLQVILNSNSAHKNEALQTEEAKAILKELETLLVDNEFARTYEQAGSVGLNAATSKDYTHYMVELPSNAFELWCWLESDRLLNAVPRQFDLEREVVLEERRSRTEDRPDGMLYELLLQQAFVEHPMRLPLIGWRNDLERLTADDLMTFYKKYYRADNIVLVLVGDLDEVIVNSLVRKYFGRLPKPTSPLPEVEIQEPKQQGGRSAAIAFEAKPQFMMGFHKPVYPSPDDAKFSILHDLLSGTSSSILERELVEDKKLVTSIYSTEGPGQRYPNLFIIGGKPRVESNSRGAKTISSQTVLSEIYAVIYRLKKDLVSEEDIQAAKKRVKVSLISTLDSNSGLATMLGLGELLHNEWGEIFQVYEVIQTTTREDIRALVRKYFKSENLTTVSIKE